MARRKINPHDAFFKSLLSDLDRARDFLGSLLPARLLEHSDLTTLKAEKASFISPALQETFADAVFSLQLNANTKGSKRAYLISILLEHKSYADDHAAFQVLEYLAHGYRVQLKNKEALRPIIPFLFYHGKNEWNLKPLAHCFDQAYAFVLPYVPQFDVIFTDLTQMPEEEIQYIANVWVRAALMTQKYSHDPKALAQHISRIFQTLSEAGAGNFWKELIVYVFSIVKISSEELKEALKPVSPAIKSQIMSTYEMIFQQGIEQGIELEKKEVILRGFNNGISIEVLALITGLSVEEVAQILEDAGK